MKYRVIGTIDNCEYNVIGETERLIYIIRPGCSLIELCDKEEKLIGILTIKVIKALALKLLKYYFDNFKEEELSSLNLIKNIISYCEKIIEDPEFVINSKEISEKRYDIYHRIINYPFNDTSQEHTLLCACQCILDIIGSPIIIYSHQHGPFDRFAYFLIKPNCESNISPENLQIFAKRRAEVIIDFFKSNEYLFSL